MPRRAKKTYHHGNLRRALLDAALAAIAEDGPNRFTLRDVARRAGVSPAAPYRHFPDKDALLSAVVAVSATRLGEVMSAAVEGATDPLDRFRCTGIAYVRFAAEHPAHFRAMTIPEVVARLSGPMAGVIDAWKRGERDRLAEAQDAGKLAPLPLDDVMLAAMCTTYGLAHLIVDGAAGFEEITPARAEELAHHVTGVLGYGLIPR